MTNSPGNSECCDRSIDCFVLKLSSSGVNFDVILCPSHVFNFRVKCMKLYFSVPSRTIESTGVCFTLKSSVIFGKNNDRWIITIGHYIMIITTITSKDMPQLPVFGF